jgi:hypothetical protein
VSACDQSAREPGATPIVLANNLSEQSLAEVPGDLINSLKQIRQEIGALEPQLDFIHL